MKFSHLSRLGAVGEITTNISGRTDEHQKGRLVNKEKDAFGWMDVEGLLACLDAITSVINSGKCGVYHHPDGNCAIAIVFNSLPCVNPCAFFDSGVFEKAAIKVTRGAVADDSQGLKVAANFQPGGGGSFPSNAAAAGGGTAILFGRLERLGTGGHTAAYKRKAKRART
jgi:hypothetical protein